MSQMLDGEFAYFVDEPAEYEPEGDHILATWHGQRFVMPISVARRALRGLSEALAKWQVADLNRVVPLLPPKH